MSVQMKNDTTTEVIVEAVIGDQTRCVSVPARMWTLEDLEAVWTTSKWLGRLQHQRPPITPQLIRTPGSAKKTVPFIVGSEWRRSGGVMNNWLLFLIAVPFLFLVPLTPKLVRLRIRFFRWLHWDWAANILENHFQEWVLFFRTILLVIAAALLYFAWTQ